jgi:hypothetical protein
MSPALMALTGNGEHVGQTPSGIQRGVLRGARQKEVHFRHGWSKEFCVRSPPMAFAEAHLFTDGGLRILKAEDNGEQTTA